MGLGGPRPSRRCLAVLDLSHCVDVTRKAMVNLRHRVAAMRVMKCLPMVLMRSAAAGPGLHQAGYISRISGGAMGASSFVTSREPSGGAPTATVRLAPARTVVTKLAALVTACLPLLRRPQAAQFVGGLTNLCSRLGRYRTSVAGTMQRLHQLVGTSFRCLGPNSAARLRNGSARLTNLRPAIRTWPGRWQTTRSASRSVPDLGRARLRPAPLVAWLPYESASPRVLALPPLSEAPRWTQLGRGVVPSLLRRLVSMATHAWMSKLVLMLPLGMHILQWPVGAAASIAA